MLSPIPTPLTLPITSTVGVPTACALAVAAADALALEDAAAPVPLIGAVAGSARQQKGIRLQRSRSPRTSVSPPDQQQQQQRLAATWVFVSNALGGGVRVRGARDGSHVHVAVPAG